jgi:hypothetical protein
MTRDKLQALSRKDLGDLARKRGIAGWHELSKDALITKILRQAARAKAERPAAKPVKSVRAKVLSLHSVSKNGTNGTHKAAKPHDDEEDERPNFGIDPAKDLSAKSANGLAGGYTKDRIVVMVRDPFWLHTYWELTHQSIQRAEAALGQDWHSAKPILRVVDVSTHDTTSTSEAIVKDIEVHGGCQNWYIEVAQPPRSYRVDVGYLSRRGQFYCLARSNVVSTPKAGISDTLDENWSDIDPKQADRIYAMSTGFDPSTPNSLELKQIFEERLRRPLGSPSLTSFGSGALSPDKVKKFGFKLDAELIVYGETAPDARVTLQGEPVKLRNDGSFTMRFSLPDSRQIIPAVAASADGVEERTIVLAIERNTKHLEPMIHEINESA